MIDYLEDLAFVFIAVPIAFMPLALLCGIAEKIMDKYNLWNRVEEFFKDPED